MWSPANIHALPTKEDHIHATNAILALEVEVEMAVIAVLQAQQQLDNLKTDILKRKAWLAPIRILPSEVLSIIFTQTAEDRWHAPLVIQAVCRLWRDIVRQTPEAWSFIPWNREAKYYLIGRLIPLFVSRSGNTPQHIKMTTCITDRNREFFTQLEQKVVCATYRYNFHGSQHSFPKLQRLKVSWNVDRSREAEMDIASILDNAPHLHAFSLRLDPEAVLTTMGDRRISNVEHLELHVHNPLKILDFLQGCSRGLKTLMMSYEGCRNTPQSTPTTIDFPRLQGLYLRENDRTHYRDDPLVVLQGHAPNLVTFMTRDHVDCFRFDTRTVQNLSIGWVWNGPIDYLAYPFVKILEFSKGSQVVGIECKDVFPQLETIFLTENRYSTILPVLEEALRKRKTWTTKRVQISEGRTVVLDRFIHPGFKCGHGRTCHADWCKWLNKDSNLVEASLELDPVSD